MAIGATVGIQIASANLTGSNFESTDGNMVVDTAGNHDWQNAPNLHVGTDVATGTGDNSFGNGTHEAEINVSVIAGSIPNSKADLGKFADASETLANGDVMLYLAWTRNNDSGTTNFDFELNKNPQPDLSTPGAKVLNRTAGDLLINYSIQGGAQSPTLNFRTWNGMVWSDPPSQFGPGIADGGFNQNNAVVNTLGGGGNIAAARFGEAAINMTAAGIIPNQNDPNAPCKSFGSVYVKSRSSSSFTSEIKDFIAPIGLSLNTCGRIIIKKVTVPSPNPFGTSFPFTLVKAPGLNKSFSLQDGGQNITADLSPGSGYVATENTPNGWTLTSAVCDHGTPSNIQVLPNQDTTCIFTNTAKATLHVVKVAERNGVNFDFTSNTLTPAAFSLANGGKQDFLNLLPGGYDVAETAKANWTNTSASCDNGNNPAAITLNPGDDVTCTFVNVIKRGALLIHKTAKHAAAPGGTFNQAGVTFTVTVNGVGQDITTDANGLACIANLPVSALDGTYNVSEHVPTGYSGQADKAYTVLQDTTCATAAPQEWVNTPLTDISVSAHSQVSGGTSSTIDCGAIGSGGPSGDPSVNATGLPPGTYTCTVVVDP